MVQGLGFVLTLIEYGFVDTTTTGSATKVLALCNPFQRSKSLKFLGNPTWSYLILLFLVQFLYIPINLRVHQDFFFFNLRTNVHSGVMGASWIQLVTFILYCFPYTYLHCIAIYASLDLFFCQILEFFIVLTFLLSQSMIPTRYLLF